MKRSRSRYPIWVVMPWCGLWIIFWCVRPDRCPFGSLPDFCRRPLAVRLLFMPPNPHPQDIRSPQPYPLCLSRGISTLLLPSDPVSFSFPLSLLTPSLPPPDDDTGTVASSPRPNTTRPHRILLQRWSRRSHRILFQWWSRRPHRILPWWWSRRTHHSILLRRWSRRTHHSILLRRWSQRTHRILLRRWSRRMHRILSSPSTRFRSSPSTRLRSSLFKSLHLQSSQSLRACLQSSRFQGSQSLRPCLQSSQSLRPFLQSSRPGLQVSRVRRGFTWWSSWEKGLLLSSC
ncbi:uncharacterized protein [Nothobranchius furzeri]|uniref:uncharacterized protein n=1 Tax=Nothobranchius furzeri TaxID=105023 RepID=UPI003904BB54